MIKYVLGKNRDRNGNGYIDYDEIVWYVPALDELAFLKEKLEAKTVKFQNSNERFHSSTPYLAGYTAEVPGRAFYVKMGQGKKPLPCATASTTCFAVVARMPGRAIRTRA